MRRHSCRSDVDGLSTLSKRLGCGGHDIVTAVCIVNGAGLLQESLLTGSLCESLSWKFVFDVQFCKDVLDSNHEFRSSLESFTQILPVSLMRKPKGEDNLVNVDDIRHTHVESRGKITAFAVDPGCQSLAQQIQLLGRRPKVDVDDDTFTHIARSSHVNNKFCHQDGRRCIHKLTITTTRIYNFVSICTCRNEARVFNHLHKYSAH